MTFKLFLKSVLAVVTGIVIGSLLNGLLIAGSHKVVPPPAGVDVTTLEGLKAGIHLLEPIHFLMPFLAHSVGTFAGAFLTAYLAPKYRMAFGLFIGFFFL